MSLTWLTPQRSIAPTLINMAALGAGWALALAAPASSAQALAGWLQALALPWAAWAWLTGVSAPASEAPWRRAQVLSAIALALSVPAAAQVAQGLLRPEGLPDALSLARLIVGQGFTPWWLGALAGLSLLPLGNALGIPPVLHRSSTAGAWLCLMAWSLQPGAWLARLLPDVPVVVWLMGALLLPFKLRHGHRAVTLCWLLCVSALVHDTLHDGLGATHIGADLLLLGLAVGMPTWVAWAHNMNLIQFLEQLASVGQAMHSAKGDADEPSAPWGQQTGGDDVDDADAGTRFSLQDHLDSPAAQEGADKYTRE